MQGGQEILALVTPEVSSFGPSNPGLIQKQLLTTLFARKSAATALADVGISMINLKCVDRWKLDKVADGYLENSKCRRKSK
eukprot:660693-Ditylum_brightwellii.AAC.1